MRRLPERRAGRPAHRSRHGQRDPGRAGAHRRRDGLQADADVLLEHHPRVGGFRRRAHRRRRPAALRDAAEHAAAVGADPRLHARHPPPARGARRGHRARRRDHAQRPLWRRLARPRRGVLRAGVSRGPAGRLLGDDRAPSRHRRADAGELRHRRRHRHLRRGAPVQGDQGVRGGAEEHGGVAHAARQHPRLRSGGGRHGGADRRGPDRRRALRGAGPPLRARHRQRRLRGSDGLFRAPDAGGHQRLPDGAYRATTYIDGYLDDREPARSDLPICVAITVAGAS